jgi:hypothetical protein
MSDILEMPTSEDLSVLLSTAHGCSVNPGHDDNHGVGWGDLDKDHVSRPLGGNSGINLHAFRFME